MVSRTKVQSGLRLSGIFCAALLLAGCSLQPYVYTRATREFTGKKLRTHTIIPLPDKLSPYQVLEVRPLDNLVLDRMPAPMERHLNEQIYANLKSLKVFPEITREGYEFIIEDPSAKPEVKPTLVFEGSIDDYEPGVRSLRLVELGYNHVAVTVRFQLRDKQTNEILSSSSITAQDDTVSGSTRSAEDKVAKRIGKLVGGEFHRKK